MNLQPKHTAHGEWPGFLLRHFDQSNMSILELGSREVTGKNLTPFKHAEYTGLDIVDGDNVDVVGDAHNLTEHFPEATQFDLIFSSAVFEHFARPWVVAEQINKMLPLGGFVFIETHFAFSLHELPHHYFHFTPYAMEQLFPNFSAVDYGLSTPLKVEYTEDCAEYLHGIELRNMFVHTEYLGRKDKG